MLESDYYQPQDWEDWVAEFWCIGCEKDTDHTFTRARGITHAACHDCNHETEIDPDDFE